MMRRLSLHRGVRAANVFDEEGFSSRSVCKETGPASAVLQTTSDIKTEGVHRQAYLFLQRFLDVSQPALQDCHVLLNPQLLCFLFLYCLGNLQALALQVVHACACRAVRTRRHIFCDCCRCTAFS